jgi:hypothetical protein
MLSVILTFVQQLPSVPKVKWVKGHQDDDKPVRQLPLPAQLNCEADTLAMEALEAILTPIPISPVFPSAICQLDIREETSTRRHAAAIRWLAVTPAMVAYLCKRNQWDQAQYYQVCWPALASARNATTNPRFAPKYCHRHLPVGVKAHRNAMKYSPICPACAFPQETNEHFLLCSAPSRLKWQRKFIIAIGKELSKLQTDETLIVFLQNTSEKLFASRIIPSQDPAFTEIIDSQAAIGWMSIYRGFWSLEWLETHKALILTSPMRNPTEQNKHYKNQDEWLSRVASFVMRQANQLWTLRNEERHGLTPAEKEFRLWTTIERELDEIYTKRHQCELQHRAISFKATVELHKRQSLLEILELVVYSLGHNHAQLPTSSRSPDTPDQCRYITSNFIQATLRCCLGDIHLSTGWSSYV